MSVKSVGIRELKTHLSKYIRDVKQGEEIMVSERGLVVARLIHVKSSDKKRQLKSKLLELSLKGKIILPTIYRRPSIPTSRKKVKGSPFSDAVIEDRR